MITNAAADRLIEADDTSVLRERASRPPTGDPTDVSQVVLSSSTAVTVRCEPVFDGRAHVGAMLRLKPSLPGAPAVPGVAPAARVALTRLAIEHDPARYSHSPGLFTLPATN
jgi:hypothetical protein